MDIVDYPVDHIGIAVEDFATALPILELVSGAMGSRPERIESQGVEVLFIGSGPARVELVRPVHPESPIVRFLERRGPGLHHIAYRVPDIAPVLAKLVAAGIEPIDREPRSGANGHRVAFLHPRSTAGVLIELVDHVPLSGG